MARARWRTFQSAEMGDTICLIVGLLSGYGADVIIVDSSAFTYARDRCVEQLDQRLHLIMAGREWTLTSLNYSGSWYLGDN